MNNDKKYWADFYQQHRKGESPSSFAEFVLDKYMIPGRFLLELGCGNGRDALFFASQCIATVALDQVEEEIEYLNSLKPKNVQFAARNFSDLSGFEGFHYVYSRFTFHAVDESVEDMVLAQLSKVLSDDGLFFIEARSLRDEDLDKEFGKEHFRRYLDYEKTVAKVEASGFEILEKIESRGLAPYKSEDPYVLRIIARKV